MSNPLYYMSLESQNAMVKAGVNGVPIRVDWSGAGLRADTPLNAWLLPSENALTVDLNWPPGRPFESGAARVHAKVFIADPQADSPKPGEVLATFEWPIEMVPEVYPFRAAVPVAVTHSMPTRLWEEAEEVEEVSDRDRLEIHALISMLRDALVAGSAEAAYQLVRYKTVDLARAHYHDVAEMEEIAVRQLAWMLGNEGLEAPVLLEPQMVLETGANGRVFLARRQGGGSAIILRSKTRAFGFNIYVSRIDGRWRIVR